MALMAALESDLRALSAEARRRYPAVKDGAEHAILKLRTLSSPSEIAHNDDILRIFLAACEVKTVKLSVIGLSCLQKLISHDAVAPAALKDILSTLKDHSEMADESVQLRTLQTLLILFQSRLHPENEEDMAQALYVCLRLLENNRSDSVRNTAAATFRQAVALVFDHVVDAESLPVGKFASGVHLSRSSSVTVDVNRRMNHSESTGKDFSERSSLRKETLTDPGKIGLRLLEDLTALAAGGSANWLHVNSLQRIFALDILEFILSTYVAVFKTLVPFEQVLRDQICSLLMTSLRTDAELEGEVGEPSFRRLVLRSVAHIIRLYSTALVTETEVFISMLVKVIFLDLPLWHRILVLEILRGFCMEARTLRILFQNFDMHPKNINVVESMVKALARVVSNVQVQEASEESLAAVAGMFSSKAKGVEWILDNDASNAAVLVASEAHLITLAIEGLLGVIFTVATLTDEAVDSGELESPRFDHDPAAACTGRLAVLCVAMVDSFWLTILDALALILSRSQGEAIVLEILKGYQAFTQACGILHAIEPLNSFLASLCKFTINIPNEAEKRSPAQSPGSKRSDQLVEQKDSIVLTPKNVQALRTLFNVSHRLHNVLGPSWVLVLETLAALDRAIHSPHASTQEVSAAVPKLTRESSGQYSDFSILSSLNSQLFESSAMMHISAVKSLLSALCQLSYQCMSTASLPGSFGPGVGQKIGTISFAVERMLSIVSNNVHRVGPLWDQIAGHFLELADTPNQHLRMMALDALDRSITATIGSESFQDHVSSRSNGASDNESDSELRTLECSIISPIRVLYFNSQSVDVRNGSLKILLNVLERHGEKLYYSWLDILELLRRVADSPEKDLISLGFKSLRVIMNDAITSIPVDCLNVCIDVSGAYSAQKTALNISLTSVGLLWTTADFIAKGVPQRPTQDKQTRTPDMHSVQNPMKGKSKEEETPPSPDSSVDEACQENVMESDQLLFSIFSLLQRLGADERPEVRNAAVRTLFQTLGSHGQKLSRRMWEDCLWNYIFPALDRASHMVATSSKDEWQGKELGTRGGKAVHMLIHHSRNTAQKQWDETLVLVLGGIARLLRSFFPFLSSLKNFWAGWESLLLFVKNSTLSGSKDVAIAAINCLQTTIISHAHKGNLPMPYLTSILEVYEHVMQRPSSFGGNATSKVKQEVIHGLGELYAQAHKMFDDRMFSQVLEIVKLAIKQAMMTNENFEAEFGHIPPVMRTVLEVLPLLRPSEQISGQWLILLREIFKYLPRSDPLPDEDEAGIAENAPEIFLDNLAKRNSETPNGAGSGLPKQLEPSSQSSGSAVTAVGNYSFAEKLVPVLVELLLQAPTVEKYIIFPEIIQSLGRCMTTRRDNPDGSLWRAAVEGFNRILIDDVCKDAEPDSKVTRSARMRVWKEVADVYEIFLLGYCGRAIPSNSSSTVALESDEALEMAFLKVLGDKILKLETDAPVDILQRLVSTMDGCGSRTCSLPVETVELMPPHCSRFSLHCLQKVFALSSCDNETTSWNSTRSEVSKIAITLLLSRCHYIFNRFLIDEKHLGDRSLPRTRLEEIKYVLQELACLEIHPETATVLPLHPYLRDGLADKEQFQKRRPHLLVIFPSLCELIVTRETKVRDCVQVLLRLVSKELGLEKEER
ncbi:Protein MON2 homolog [Linum grandiflorum]